MDLRQEWTEDVCRLKTDRCNELPNIIHTHHTSGISQFQGLALHSKDFGKSKVLAANSRITCRGLWRRQMRVRRWYRILCRKSKQNRNINCPQIWRWVSCPHERLKRQFLYELQRRSLPSFCLHLHVKVILHANLMDTTPLSHLPRQSPPYGLLSTCRPPKRLYRKLRLSWCPRTWLWEPEARYGPLLAKWQYKRR